MSTVYELVTIERSSPRRISFTVRVSGEPGSLTAKIVQVKTKRGVIVPEADWPDSEEVGVIGVEAIEQVEKKLAPNPAPAPGEKGPSR